MMSQTIYFLIRGGLGNQLFQYAAGLYAEPLWGFPVQFHVRQDHGAHPRLFMLDQFQVTRPLVPVGYWARHLFYGSRHNALKKAIRRILDVRVIDELSPYQVDPQLLTFPSSKTTLFRGYWQSQDYLSGQTERLRSEFRFRYEPSGFNATWLAEIKSKSCPVSLHIRRGDYVGHQGITLLPLNYYQAAIQTIQARFGDAHFFVFSDDLDWARNHLPAESPVTFVEGNGEAQAHEDLRLMSACAHHIIANSTFSWWGAWLNPSPEKTVLMPKFWIGTNPTPASLIANGWETADSWRRAGTGDAPR